MHGVARHSRSFYSIDTQGISDVRNTNLEIAAPSRRVICVVYKIFETASIKLTWTIFFDELKGHNEATIDNENYIPLWIKQTIFIV